jgi:L-histidine Nalpha-methyltransferase
MREATFTDLLPADFDIRTLRDDVRRGLGSRPKALPPRWFYDKVGSELFEDITRLPEYYPTRTERGILTRRAAEIIEAAGDDTLVELGSGSSSPTTPLLDALVSRARRRRTQVRYVALDVSEDALRGAALALRDRYPELEIDLLRADFVTQLDRLPDPGRGGRRLVAFLGSTIGNFEPASRARFLAALRTALNPGEHLLLGADLVKPRSVLEPAYDDARGVTAAFNLNVLDVLNHRLGADFDRRAFRHVAHWDETHEWIEMRLRAEHAMTVHIRDLDLAADFAEGEELLTEISAKFRADRLHRELLSAGFDGAGWWTDDLGWFSLSLWRAR